MHPLLARLAPPASRRPFLALASRVCALITVSAALSGLSPAMAAMATVNKTDATPDATAVPSLMYAIRVPPGKPAHPPLLVLLHGRGADENDLMELASYLPPSLLVVSPRAPMPNQGSGYSWYDNMSDTGRLDGNPAQVEASRQAILKLVDSVSKKYAVDPRHIFIGGFSQGAVLTYDTVLQSPSRFRGAVVLSGSIFPSLQQRLAAEAAHHPDYTHEDFFVGHGTADPTVDVSYAQDAEITLKKMGVKLSFHLYPGMHHEVNQQELSDLNTWLTARLQ